MKKFGILGMVGFLVWGSEFKRDQRSPHALAALQEQLENLVLQFNQGAGNLHLDVLEPYLTALEQAISQDSATLVNLHGEKGLLLEAKNQVLFGRTPILPPETKHQGTWRFEPVRFQLVPNHLYVYSVSFKGSRTIRLKAVTLFFGEGEPIRHAVWEAMENGNGNPFPKETYLPALAVNGADAPRHARNLKAIEILGSAQDGLFPAELDFLLEVPDPDEPGPRNALNWLQHIKRSWRDQPITANQLNTCLTDFKELAARLEIDFCINHVAED